MYVIKLEIIIRHNHVYLKKANLGKNFSDLIADLTVNKSGKVKVKVRPNLSFNTNLDYLPSTILVAMSKRLEKKANNRTFTRIAKKIESALDIKRAQKILD